MDDKDKWIAARIKELHFQIEDKNAYYYTCNGCGEPTRRIVKSGPMCVTCEKSLYSYRCSSCNKNVPLEQANGKYLSTIKDGALLMCMECHGITEIRLIKK